MSDDHAFLAAISEQPDDGALRLVYADWLEERGDERHELVRVEAAMRAVPIWSDEFQRLKPARARLRAALPAEWLAAMDYLPKHRSMFGTLPPTAAERWRLAEEFIDIWHGGLKPGDGYTEAEVADAEGRLGVRLPEALREWYLRAGKRADVWSNQDALQPPEWIRFEGDRLIFHRENQNCDQWYVTREHLSYSDPPVYASDGNRIVANAVSEFMLFVLVYESQFRHIWFGLDRMEGLQMPPRFSPAELPLRYTWQRDMVIREATDVVLFGEAWGSCRTEEAFQQVLADFKDRVERFEP